MSGPATGLTSTTQAEAQTQACNKIHPGGWWEQNKVSGPHGGQIELSHVDLHCVQILVMTPCTGIM